MNAGKDEAIRSLLERLRKWLETADTESGISIKIDMKGSSMQIHMTQFARISTDAGEEER